MLFSNWVQTDAVAQSLNRDYSCRLSHTNEHFNKRITKIVEGVEVGKRLKGSSVEPNFFGTQSSLTHFNDFNEFGT